MRSKNTGSTDSSSEELTFQEEVNITEVPSDLIPPVSSPQVKQEVKEVEIFDEKEDTPNVVWANDIEDTEEVSLISPNVNQSTGGFTDLSKVFRAVREETIDVKHTLVF